MQKWELSMIRCVPCEKCSEKGADKYTLTGGRDVYLCVPCANSWTEWILSQETYAEFRRLAAMVEAANIATVEAGVAALLEYQRKLFALSGTWLAEKIKKDAP